MPVKKITRVEKKFITNSDDRKSKTNTQLVTLRIPEDLLKEIDDRVLSRPLKTSRNMWILEVIYRALNNEEKS